MDLIREFKAPKKCRHVEGTQLIHNTKGQWFIWVWAISFVHSHIYIYDVDSLSVIRELVIDRKRKSISALKQMPNGQIWMGFSDGHIRLYNPDSLDHMDWPDAFRYEITALSHLPLSGASREGASSHFLACGSDSHGWVTVWRVEGEYDIHQIASSEAHIGTSVTCLAACPLLPSEAEGDVDNLLPNSPRQTLNDSELRLFDDWQKLYEVVEEGGANTSFTTNSSTMDLNESFSLSETSAPSFPKFGREIRRRLPRLVTFLVSGDLDGRLIIWESKEVCFPSLLYSLSAHIP